MKYQTAVNKLKKIAKGRYCAIKYERTYFASGGSKQECSVYIDSYDWYSSPTWEQTFKLLEQAIKKPPANDNDAPVDELEIKEEE